MRTIFVLTLVVTLVVLIGGGFLLSETFHMRQELNEANQQIAQLQNAMEALRLERDAAIASLNDANSKLAELQHIRQTQDTQLAYLTNENAILKDQYVALQKQAAVAGSYDAMLLALSNVTGKAFLPIIPIPLIASYLIYRRKRSR